MEENVKKLDDQELENASGGGLRVQNSNFCSRCRSSSYKVLRKEDDGTELRECKVCHFEYKYRKW